MSLKIGKFEIDMEGDRPSEFDMTAPTTTTAPIVERRT